ncbi:hypothetical protein B566_EDAN007913 [Ephemera danica]|nr:hypothetical protein B566_EDAN007913 [Ephemera danica]
MDVLALLAAYQRKRLKVMECDIRTILTRMEAAKENQGENRQKNAKYLQGGPLMSATIWSSCDVTSGVQRLPSVAVRSLAVQDCRCLRRH